MDLKALIKKHSQAGPRYTSYPTAPQWSEKAGLAEYREHLKKQAGKTTDLALYFHIPFCESLCYYCGCNIKITKDHSREMSYVNALIGEMETVSALMGKGRSVTQVSWGGGTPTFLSLAAIRRLAEATQRLFRIHADAEVSIEIDPRVTSFEQLKLLRELGFNRVSLGVQDFNEATQKSINRVQSIAMTETMLRQARQLGFKGINFDLIYGLPYQTLDTFDKTLKEIARIRPDRIAFYNYAHLPQMIPHQKILDKFPMPSADERVDIFTFALETLTKAGYKTIGMDHFAVEEDELYQALKNGTLYRNFMGYTVKRGTDMIGLGSSAIGEIDQAFFQNVKEVKDYEESIAREGLAAFRGIFLSEDDVQRKWIIQSLMCQFELNFGAYQKQFGSNFTEVYAAEIAELSPFFDEGSLSREANAIRVTDRGRLFLRNIAMVFDAYLKAKGTFKNYSRTV